MTLKEKMLENVKINGSCWIWTAAKNNGGYGRIRVGKKTKYAHRVSFEIFRGCIAKFMNVLHRCDTPSCINPDHLFLGTHAENMADRNKKCRQARQTGMQNPLAKLTDIDVIAIRSAKGILQRDLAVRYGVSRGHISFIRTGKKWSHLQCSV